MSSGSDTIFNIYYGGKFVKSRGVITYDGGETHVLETAAQSLFNSMMSGLNISLYGHRIWYKAPYEELKEAKIMWNGSDSFERMCSVAMWTKVIDIFMEKDDDVNEGDQGDANHDGEGTTRNERNDVRIGKETQYAQDARVEAIVSQFVDEEENDDDRNTPPVSDNEEDNIANIACPYERWSEGSGELKILQLFESVNEFHKAVLDYALKGGWNIKYNKWGDRGSAICAAPVEEGGIRCTWKAYVSYDEQAGSLIMKTLQDKHTCFKDGRCKLLTENVIAEIFLNDVRNDPSVKPKFFQEQIMERYNINAKNDQCRNAKRKALKIIQTEYDEQYSRMKDYENSLLETNPGSSTELRTILGDGELEMFDRFYVCFAGLRDTWLTHCRPIFGIDGCFLKTTTKGQLLAAVGRDANNQVYPFAWAVVQVESTDTWRWFIQKLKIDLKLGNGDGFTLISDRQKGLLKAVDEELPEVEHRMCARHIYGNLKKIFSKKPKMKKLFWKIAESPNKADYNESLEKLKNYDVDVHEALLKRNPESCSRAFFKTTSTCEDGLNNFSESYNSAINKLRELPLVEMLETMRRQAMARITIRRNKVMRHKGQWSPRVGKVISLEEEHRKWCKTIAGPAGTFEVREKGVSHYVKMRMKTCSCRRWDLTGIPCRHVLRVLMDDKTYKIDDLIASCYATSTWKKQYKDSCRPVEGLKFWEKSDEPRLAPPKREKLKGRKKNPPKRIKGVNESPTKGKKATQHGRVMHCSSCNSVEHNVLRCPNRVEPYMSRAAKRAKKQITSQASESMTLDGGEGPSQPTQDSAT